MEYVQLFRPVNMEIPAGYENFLLSLLIVREDTVTAGDDSTGENVRAGIFVHISGTEPVPGYPVDSSGMMATVSGYAVEEIYTKGKMWPFFLQKPATSPGARLVTGREDAVTAGDDFTGENVRDGV